MNPRKHSAPTIRFALAAVLAGVTLGFATPASRPQAAGGDGDQYLPAVHAAARELARQLNQLQWVFPGAPGEESGRGLYKQTDQIQTALIYFRQQLQRKVGREQLYIAFDPVDAKVKQLLSDIQGLEQWNKALKMVADRVQQANHDLHFALSVGDGTPARGAQALYRQTLVLLADCTSLESLVRYVFAERPPLKAWVRNLEAVRSAAVALQKAQQDKAAKDELQKLFRQLDQAWEKVMAQFRVSGQDQFLLIQQVARVDQVLGRIARLVGIDNRRPPLTDPWS
jgi:hypothetical protein